MHPQLDRQAVGGISSCPFTPSKERRLLAE
jgi:hypothetical protein